MKNVEYFVDMTIHSAQVNTIRCGQQIQAVSHLHRLYLIDVQMIQPYHM